jgi:hypothetical protein
MKEAADRCDNVKGVFQEKSRNYETEIKMKDEDRSSRTENLRQKHNGEIASFENRWADPTHLSQFNKPSPRLILLRTTERRLAILRQFDRAKRLKLEADKLERTELLQAQRRAIDAMKLEYANMESRHERQLFGLQGFRDRSREELEQQRDAVLEPLQLIIARLSAIAEKPALPERRKEGVYLEQAWPESPRQVKNVRKLQPFSPGQALSLDGIRLRDHITVKKAEPAKESGARKQKKTSTSL